MQPIGPVHPNFQRTSTVGFQSVSAWTADCLQLPRRHGKEHSFINFSKALLPLRKNG